MNSRWHMNRMGFVNFWLYDEETFSFEDGKMLLRGQNGSGKSITTQSFIPFILDGDRSPARLDPFGSSDRKMEYYFLGENDKEESTGYLFLEFKRGDVAQYRTIGIGQRAQKGKPMSFWGFVILDGKRIGDDLKLYREVGNNKIPCTKRELKEILGEGNAYTESQREYMELVNRHIFGFPNIEQYNQFIRLLIKVRAPKLSKEFKPTKIYEILNDSLQILSDEDMRAMVEAMEKMDEIQFRLDGLRAAFKETQIIRNEYQRYNQYMLGKKAQTYREEKAQADAKRDKIGQKELEETNKKNALCELEKMADALETERNLLEKEQEVLHVEDIEASVEKLRLAEKEQRDAQAAKRDLEEKIQHCRENILIYDGRMRECSGKIELLQSDVSGCLEELNGENETIQTKLHDQTMHMLDAASQSQIMKELDAGLRQLERTVREGCQALKVMGQQQENWNRAEEKLQKMQHEFQDVRQKYAALIDMEENCKDRMIEQFYILQAENHEMAMSRDELGIIGQQVQAYGGPADFGGIRDLYYGIWNSRNRALSGERIELQKMREQCYCEKKELEEELAMIRGTAVLQPVRSVRSERARQILKEKGIPFLPFYEAVEFVDGLSQEKKDRIECQLMDAGILDALIVPEAAWSDAWKELQALSDKLLMPNAKMKENYPYLRAAESEESLQRETHRILRSICCIKDGKEADLHDWDGCLIIGEDGYFKNGVLEGHAEADSEAAYIGAAARQRAKEKLIAQKEAELRAKEAELETADRNLALLMERIENLAQELQLFPSFTELDRILDDLQKSRKEQERYGELLAEQEEITQKAKENYKQAEQNVIRICRPLPYMRKADVYQEVIDAIERYRDNLSELGRILSRLENERIRQNDIAEMLEKEEEIRETQYDYMRQADRRLLAAKKQIDRVNEYLNDPDIRKMAERLKRIRERMAEIVRQEQQNGRDMAVCGSQIDKLEEEIGELREELQLLSGREKKAQQYFEEELALGLVFGEEDQPEMQQTEAAAHRAETAMRESDRQRSGVEMTTALMKTFQAHLSDLSGYGTMMEECFADEDSSMLRSRQRIVSVWNGQKLYLEEFYNLLKESIESTELLIQQKDRELFEGILADTLSRKLSGRIRESRRWIQDMSALMRQMDTSMALTFSLDWRPKTAEDSRELDTQELEKILSREKELLTDADIDKVSQHFRNRIHTAKQNALENGEDVNYMELVRDALDYRKWFEFRMNYYRNNDNKKELTNGAFNRLSGGEKAMAMYVPLFAAVNAQYKKAGNRSHPRIIALDEAFAGVDDKNISSMFELVHQLDFDYIMNSQVLWGCYESVKNLRIAELLRPANTDVVTVINYRWNGRERILDE